MSLPTSLSTAPTASERAETLERPEPGLARGRWEAPASFFYVVLVVTILGTLVWAVLSRRARSRRDSTAEP